MAGQVWARVTGERISGRTVWTARCTASHGRGKRRQWSSRGVLDIGTHNGAHSAAARHNRWHRAQERSAT